MKILQNSIPNKGGLLVSLRRINRSLSGRSYQPSNLFIRLGRKYLLLAKRDLKSPFFSHYSRSQPVSGSPRQIFVFCFQNGSLRVLIRGKYKLELIFIKN